MPLNNHLREQWVKRGYCAYAASAAVAVPPPDGFRRAYHLTSVEHAVSNIAFSRIKIARFRELNDPFELLSLTVRHPDQRARLQKHNADVDGKFGVVCFSEDWIDPVLWSHYGAKHRGIALGFDLNEAHARKVTYRSERINFPQEMNPEEAVLPHISTKFKSWQYEREWRVFVKLESAQSDGKLFFEPFSNDVRLREVILGPACTHAVQTMRELVNTHHKNVVTIKSRLAEKYYSVVPQEDTVPRIPSTKTSSWPFPCPCAACSEKKRQAL
jgi:Protein of unknown function (DUF2971)